MILFFCTHAHAATTPQIEFMVTEADKTKAEVLPIPLPNDPHINLDLGAELVRLKISGFVVPIPGELIVEQRFESSVTVMHEGPHIDLTEWKHGYTPWVRLKPLEDNQFAVRPGPDRLPFPKVTSREIVAALKKRNNIEERWFQIGAQCKNAETEPCAVGTSQIQFRIRIKEKGGNIKTLWQVSARPPMGC